ncbi:steroid 5-alpha-reductase DET2 [Mercurialis annua]|uniref:steroid 5-alpha-reductase DET2 n=1 Tax=Mercurialis annua TaxID=3986 RepID=UPI00215F72FB|nr:steroid 5-alpha-reductase DET2 [Mercurialis annua]XP_050214346.1 steroid 5-alpha-reductase DET2 [Mercurialis annua]XP_050214347.1 steroid 5-alpha-reductase DET2 [Mercurialis annua]
MAFSDQRIFHNSLVALYLIGPPTFISLKFLQAPYGKHNRPGWGPSISPPLAWFLMESPTLWLTFLLFPFGQHANNPKALILMSPYLIHYFHRTCVYPIRLYLNTDKQKTKAASGFPISVALMAFAFNLLNAYLQARWVSNYKEDYESDGWFWWKFCSGLLVFASGMWINIWSDRVLVGLKRGGGGYKIPRGGLFELVSCPNYFGETMEWLGWTVLTWSWTGFAFFLYTFANLVPRACANHKWYLEKFGEDYPRSRKAVIPFLY